MNKYTPKPAVRLTHPEWSKDAVIYQINTRQFTPEGTFKAAETHLPRLKELGVDILWLMPIHEIGQKNRKGTLGSPYAVKDYYSVNPEFGTLEDIKHFVDAAHAQGFRVILDWVPNHTAWDSVLVSEHPDWYTRNWKGDFHPTPWWDWSDIIDLNYALPEVREYMTEAMKYWVRDMDVDGFRCDVAGFVPTDFWNTVRKELDAIKPVFMLAEWESRDLHEEAFDMTYAWTWYDTLLNIVKGDGDVSLLHIYYSWNEKAYPFDIMRMLFTSNHDKNSWEGTMNERFHAARDAVIALTFVSEGMPLIYNSQEAGEEKRLDFFEKDSIQWKDHPINDYYKKLIVLKKKNTALWNAHWGARMVHVPNSAPEKVFSFVRQNEQDKVFAVFNFSPMPQSVTFSDALFHGKYTDFTSGAQVEMSASTRLELKPWDFLIYTK
ncbi:MAG: alpha-glucosidase C-terminal domain-containing protein [Anaerolineales bacterium]|nr:alpha-glucosidase C-terminal domain-containing protein [Anaerolineales bacterium]